MRWCTQQSDPHQIEEDKERKNIHEFLELDHGLLVKLINVNTRVLVNFTLLQFISVGQSLDFIRVFENVFNLLDAG